MKLLYAFLALLLVTGAAAKAQDTRDTIRPAAGENTPEKMRVKMITELGLTKKQAQQLKEVNAEYMPKIKALRTDSTMDRRDKRKQVTQLMQQREDKLKTILTPDQMTKYRELQKEQMQERRKKKDGDNEDMSETINT